jgi:hypothetical protein
MPGSVRARFSVWFSAWIAVPVETSADHELQHQEVVLLEVENDPLAHALDVFQNQALNRRNGRIGGSQQERVDNADALQSLTQNQMLQTLDVDDDLRIFWQRQSSPRPPKPAEAPHSGPTGIARRSAFRNDLPRLRRSEERSP